MMEGTPFLPLPEGMLIDQVQITENGLLITVIATHPTSRCPLCSKEASDLHSSYRRRVRDVSCGRAPGRALPYRTEILLSQCAVPAQDLYRTDTSVCGAVGTHDHPTWSGPASHRALHLWQRR